MIRDLIAGVTVVGSWLLVLYGVGRYVERRRAKRRMAEMKERRVLRWHGDQCVIKNNVYVRFDDDDEFTPRALHP
jgi:hypothetical protein